MSEPRNMPPIPNGWFAVASSKELRRGEVRPLRGFGRDLVLYRSEAGVPAVLDRYCPHLGASLAHGGKVAGEALRCPFHGWTFDGAGRCLAVPHEARVPPLARARAFPTAEANGLIHVHHHADDAPPARAPVAFEELESARFTHLGGYTFRLRSHPQELGENAFDLAHFPTVHRTTHPYDVELSSDAEVFGVRLKTRPMVAGRVLPLTADVHILCYGLGLVRVNVRIGTLVNLIAFSYAMPVEHEEVRVRHLWVTEAGRGAAGLARRLAGWAAGLASMHQAYQDRVIWEHKIHRERPVLAPGDRAIAGFRRWARQFYSVSKRGSLPLSS